MLQTTNKVRGPVAATTARLGALLTIAALAASPVGADDRQEVFEMTVIRDAAFGAKVVSGKHGEAIERINALNVREPEQFFVHTNLCVAYTMTRKFEAAAIACDGALADLADQSATMPASKERIVRRYKAMALSNRGVLRAVTGDDRNARADFDAAVALEAGVSAPERNLAYLETRTVPSVTMLQADQ